MSAILKKCYFWWVMWNCISRLLFTDERVGRSYIWKQMPWVACQCRCKRTRIRSPSGEDPPGGGHGNPLQYSCLENPMDRGAWRATGHGVKKSWTRLKWLSTGTQLKLKFGLFIGWLLYTKTNFKMHVTLHSRCLPLHNEILLSTLPASQEY